MNKYNLMSLFALLAIVLLIPWYASGEAARLQTAQEGLRQQTLDEAAISYGKLCATCHGLAGEGQGVMPALDSPALAEADSDALFTTIARAAHGTGMAAWHKSEGGILNDYQIEQLVILIKHADWNAVKTVALENNLGEAPVTAAELEEAFMWIENSEDPHSCVSCHEEPELHKESFGPNCARCHSSVAWTPAVLTKHNFSLEHGGDGKLECQSCHVENYFTHSCYACHDHQPEDMRVVHREENIVEYDNCIECHPTGAEGEGDQYWNGAFRDSNTSQYPGARPEVSLSPGVVNALP